MSLKDFRVTETLGKGSFATVYKVQRKSDGKVYALKRVKINKMSKKEISDALNEIRFLASIRHKNIVGFLESFLENNETELCIVMEYCGCGDLAQKIERYKRRKQYMDEDVIWRYLIQSLKALQHIHENGICHRDLKAANTFLADDGSIKIGDMNVSKRLDNGHLQTQIGTPYYMAPEIWQNRPYDFSCDIWALGCLIYELASLKPPFLADSFPALKKVITAGRFPPLPSKYSEALTRVVTSMLRLTPRQRPTAEILLRSTEISTKLHLDATEKVSEQPSLIKTIQVPQNLRKLGSALPKPCYKDVRPNSPTAWTVAEQKQSKHELMAAEFLRRNDHKGVPSTISENEDPIQQEKGIKESHAKAAVIESVRPILKPISNNAVPDVSASDDVKNRLKPIAKIPSSVNPPYTDAAAVNRQNVAPAKPIPPSNDRINVPVRKNNRIW